MLSISTYFTSVSRVLNPSIYTDIQYNTALVSWYRYIFDTKLVLVLNWYQLLNPGIGMGASLRLEVYLMVAELLPLPPLGVEASVDKAVFADLLLLASVLGCHLEDVSHSLGQLLVQSQQALHLSWVRPWKGPQEPVHTLQHCPGCLGVELPASPGRQGARAGGRAP